MTRKPVLRDCNEVVLMLKTQLLSSANYGDTLTSWICNESIGSPRPSAGQGWGVRGIPLWQMNSQNSALAEDLKTR
jgi:hypothetical protein